MAARRIKPTSKSRKAAFTISQQRIHCEHSIFRSSCSDTYTRVYFFEMRTSVRRLRLVTLHSGGGICRTGRVGIGGGRCGGEDIVFIRDHPTPGEGGMLRLATEMSRTGEEVRILERDPKCLLRSNSSAVNLMEVIKYSAKS